MRALVVAASRSNLMKVAPIFRAPEVSGVASHLEALLVRAPLGYPDMLSLTEASATRSAGADQSREGWDGRAAERIVRVLADRLDAAGSERGTSQVVHA
jgi:hypothetical protein